MNYYGKYRAKVVDVKDPQKRGRIRVLCPKVLGEASSAWCEPCIPVAYDFGGDFALPKVGEFVWVEFEDGNPNKPVYTGGLWRTNSSPSSSYDPNTRIISWGDCKIEMINDTTNDTIKLKVGSSVVEISSGSVRINSPSVTVNGTTIPQVDI